MKCTAILTTIPPPCATLAGARNKQTGKQFGLQIIATETEFDFGPIKEVDGPVSHTFTIKNTGTAPLVFTRVITPCSCMKSESETAPIAPSKSITVKMTCNPAGRPDQFVKTTPVYSSGKDGSCIPCIKGTVEQSYCCKRVRTLQSLEAIHAQPQSLRHEGDGMEECVSSELR